MITFVSLLYFLSFVILLFKCYKKRNESTLKVIILLIANLYGLIPFITYNILGNEDVFDNYYSVSNYVSYLIHFTVFNTTGMLFLKLKIDKKINYSIKKNKLYSFIFSLIGLLLFIMQWYLTGAIDLISSQNKGLILSSFFSIPPIYEYFLYPGFALYLISSNSKKDIFRFELLAIFLFVTIMLMIGNRGPVLYILVLVIFSLGYKNRLELSKKLIFAGVIFISVLIFFSIRARFKEKLSVIKAIELVKENPELASLANLEYAWGLRNYNHLKSVKFKQRFPFESYVISVLKGPAKILGYELVHPSKRFRNIYHSDRMSKGGEYAGTGYSLFYEAEMNFGLFFSFIPYVFLFFLLHLLEKYTYRSIFGIMIFSFIINDFMVIIRSGLPFSNFIYKPIYGLVIYILIEFLYIFVKPYLKKNN
jgi:hypothetical protein